MQVVTASMLLPALSRLLVVVPVVAATVAVAVLFRVDEAVGVDAQQSPLQLVDQSYFRFHLRQRSAVLALSSVRLQLHLQQAVTVQDYTGAAPGSNPSVSTAAAACSVSGCPP